MSDDRVNIKTTENLRDQLREQKREGETWDGLLARAADALETQERQRDHWRRQGVTSDGAGGPRSRLNGARKQARIGVEGLGTNQADVAAPTWNAIDNLSTALDALEETDE